MAIIHLNVWWYIYCIENLYDCRLQTPTHFSCSNETSGVFQWSCNKKKWINCSLMSFFISFHFNIMPHQSNLNKKKIHESFFSFVHSKNWIMICLNLFKEFILYEWMMIIWKKNIRKRCLSFINLIIFTDD